MCFWAFGASSDVASALQVCCSVACGEVSYNATRTKSALLQAEAQQAAPSVEGARKSASKGVAAKVKQGKSAAKQAASSNGAAPKKKGGFLQALGLGQESVYADDDN
jgi:type IV secretory pathway TrbL component